MTLRPPPRRLVDHVMGMPISLALRGPDADSDAATDAWQRALAQLRHIDQVFSTFRPDSWICRLNRGEVSVEQCPPEVGEVLALADRARIESDGAFDIRIDDGLDPSGVVKGWAIDKVSRAFDAVPSMDLCLSAGGDMVCRTVDARSDSWHVGVEDPHDTTRIVAMIPIRNGAVATSGLAARGAHIRDQRTGQVPSALASVTVVADELTWADIDATAAFVLGLDAVDWLESRGRSGLVVDAGGTARVFGR